MGDVVIGGRICDVMAKNMFVFVWFKASVEDNCSETKKLDLFEDVLGQFGVS